MGAEFFTSGGIQDSSAGVDDMGYVLGGHLEHISVDQALPATADTDYFNAAVYSRSDHSTHGSVHAWGIPAGGENTDPFYGIVKVTFTHGCVLLSK